MTSIRTVAAVSLLALALSAAGIVAAVSDGTASTALEDGPDHQIQVSAGGQVQTEADQVVLRVAVVATAPDVSTARQRLAENTTRMREALADAGVEGDQIVTAYYDIDEDHRREAEGEQRYRAFHAFRITLEEVDRVGEIIDTAVANGATQVDDVSFGLSRERRLDLRQRAVEDALDNARREATTIAARSNLTVTDVASVTTSEVNRSPVRRETALASAGAGDAATSIEGGPVTVTATVRVTYNATTD